MFLALLEAFLFGMARKVTLVAIIFTVVYYASQEPPCVPHGYPHGGSYVACTD